MVAKTQKVRTKRNQSRLARELLETARDMRASGLMTRAAHDKITKRHIAGPATTTPAIFTGSEIKALREKVNLSQAVFAQLLNLTTGYVSQLERGVKRPSGPAVVLLDVIRRKGIDAIL